MPRSATRLITILIFLLAPPLLLLLLALAGGGDRAAAQNFTSTPCSTETSELAPSFMPPDVTSVNTPRGTSSPTPSPIVTIAIPCSTPSTVSPILDAPLTGSGTGLWGDYFNGASFNTFIDRRLDATVGFSRSCPNVPHPSLPDAGAYSIRWTGQVEAVVTGYYHIVTDSDDGVRVWLNGVNLIDHWNIHPQARDVSRAVYLIGGQKYDIRAEYYQGQCQSAVMQLMWTYPGQTIQTIPMLRLYPTRSPDTIGIYRYVSGTGGVFYLRYSNTAGYSDVEIQLTYAQSGDIPIVGDWNGDGIDSVGLYRPSTKQFFLDNNNFDIGQALESPTVIIPSGPDESFYISYSGGSGNYVPIVGKWSNGLTPGQMSDRVGLYDPTNNNFVFRTTISGTATPLTPVSTAMGATPNATDRATFGDWPGNNVSYNGIFRPSNGLWYLYSVSPLVYGNPGAIPVVGDWDGDFDDGIGVYQNGDFYLKYVPSTGYSDINFTYGDPSDQYPVAGRWAYQTLQPTPSDCRVTVRSGKTAYFRIQPHLDDRGLTPSGENWLYQLLPTPTGTPYGYGVGTVAPSGWLWQSLGASAPVLPYRVAEIKKIASIGVIPWIHPTVQWIQVEVQSSAGAVMRGYLNLTDPADGSTVLDVSGSCTSGSGNVPTPEVTMPVAPTSTSGIVMPTMYSIFGGLNNVGTGTPTPAPKIAPAVMGSCFLHDGSVGGACSSNSSKSTIDLIPRNIELCIDARDANRLDECDADATPAPNGIPVYSPVKGCIFYTSVNNIVIEFSPTGQTYLNGCDAQSIRAYTAGTRYQVSLTHVKPPGSQMAVWRNVEAGQLIGYLCNRTEWRAEIPICVGPVSLDKNAPQHLALHLYTVQPTSNTGVADELPNDIRSFLAHPHCFFDRWKSTNGSTPMLQTPPANQSLFGCP